MAIALDRSITEVFVAGNKEYPMRYLLPSLMAVVLAVPAVATTTKMSTKLIGAAEAPGPGAEKGTGLAKLAFDSEKGHVCYTLTASGTDTPTMAHIHKGAIGTPGPVVVSLTAPANGRAKGCTPVAADVMSAIIATPSDYYVNVHTAAFPKGAMRGQLSR
ncbi:MULTISPECIES: CHRD domain-containing protein [Sphingosinicellaceae]|uniref:CHRD domain-containing protein n=1 Tax=Sphingosinicellaceae TaxID=2820280 RepID=UPI001C1E5782|nr:MULTISPECIES: CHRD domain-containing protein [Polymorphobacter]QYE33472.1 CHRD domain-containing protein [Polymorphobacter sp. PAMC 29334]UAJ12837.1 CHRD domain-containing protein [Polymorphobacter megasporae]